MHTTAITSKSW